MPSWRVRTLPPNPAIRSGHPKSQYLRQRRNGLRKNSRPDRCLAVGVAPDFSPGKRAFKPAGTLRYIN
jgi:hypothetical protein